MKRIATLTALAAMAVLTTGQASANLVSNPGFETGDFSGPYVIFDSVQNQPNPNGGVVSITNDAKSGNFAARIFNDDPGSASILKVANVGVGVVQPNSTVDISFWAKGSGDVGGVAFAEVFSELAGGGTSSSQILTGAPLSLTNQYQLFTFNDVATGSDVSGGVTLQFNAATGAATGSASEFFVDDISIVPEPGSLALLGLGGLAALRRRRRN